MPAMLRGTAAQWGRRVADSEFLTRLAIPGGLALATFGAASPWLHAFRVPGQWALLVVASVVPVGVTALVAGVYRRPALVSYGISAGLLAVVLLSASGLHVGPLLSDLIKVPDRLLSETLPLSGSPILLSPVVLITWLCGAIGTELVYRTSSRSAAGDVALVVPIASFVLSYAVAVGAPSRIRLAGAMVLVGVATVAVVRQDLRSSWAVAAAAPDSVTSATAFDPRAIPPRRRTVLGRSVVASVALAVVLTAVVPSVDGLSGKPTTLNRPAPVSSALITDPVGTTAALRDGDPRSRSFEVVGVVTDRPAPGYFAAAVLDNYDGSQWTFDATFEPTGGRVPASGKALPLVDAENLRATETIESSLPSRLLPVADRAVSVSGPPVAVDGLTGMVLPGRQERGTAFAVTSRVPAASLPAVPSFDGIGTPSGSSTPGSVADLTIPPDSTTAMAAAMRFVSRLTGERPAPTVAFLQRLLVAFRTQERHLTPYAPVPSGPAVGSSGQIGGTGASPPSTAAGESAAHLGGTSLSEVINAVTVNRSATPEQFATFFTLVARYLGVPARLATGFRLVSSSSGVALSSGSHQAGNRQAWTWVEVAVSGMGWVVADPTSDAVTGVAAPPPEQAQAAPTTLPVNKANAVPNNSTTGGHAIAKPAHIPRTSPGGIPDWSLALIATSGLLVLLLSWPAASAVRRRLRSRARQSADPALIAAGAWLELLDGLERAGMHIGRSSTGSEVADDAGGHFGATVGPQVMEIAEVANRGLYSLFDPPGVDESQQAWNRQRQLTREIIRSLDRRQKAKALVAVGSGPRRPSG